MLAFSLLSVLELAAADRTAPWGVAYVVGPSANADASLREIIAGTIGLQLTRRNAPPEELPPATDGPPVLSRTIAQAADRNAQYLILATYTTSSGDIAIELTLYDVSTAQQVGKASQSGPINLSLDALVAQALSKAAGGVEFRQPVLGGTTGGGGAVGDTEAATNTGAPSGTGASNGTGAPSGTGTSSDTTAAIGTGRTGTTGASGTSGLTGTTGAGSSRASRPPRKGTSLGITTGAAPLLLTGPAGAYANLGSLATISVAFRFPLGPGTMGAGILSGVGSLKASGAVTTAEILLVPMGVDAQYTLNDGGFPAITLHVGGGPSLLNVAAKYLDSSPTKVIPYLLAGMTLELPFSSFMGMAVEAAWTTFFESSALPIMAFAPEVSFYVRF